MAAMFVQPSGTRGTNGMSDLESFRKFEYRPSRMKTGFNIDFIAKEGTFHGICVDISGTGLRGEFDGLVVVGSSGELILSTPSGVLNLEAQVTHAEESRVGLVFQFKTPLERGMATRFIASIGRCTAVSRPR